MSVVPNILSIIRLLLAFYFPFAPRDQWVSIVVIAGFTEWADGFLARRFKLETKFGIMMDPIADKVFFLAVVATLMQTDTIQLWEILLLSLRELAVLSGIFWVSLHKQWKEYDQMKPKWSGKVTTAVQYPFFFSVIYFQNVNLMLFLITVGVGAWSAIDYITWFIKGGSKTQPEA